MKKEYIQKKPVAFVFMHSQLKQVLIFIYFLFIIRECDSQCDPITFTNRSEVFADTFPKLDEQKGYAFQDINSILKKVIEEMKIIRLDSMDFTGYEFGKELESLKKLPEDPDSKAKIDAFENYLQYRGGSVMVDLAEYVLSDLDSVTIRGKKIILYNIMSTFSTEYNVDYVSWEMTVTKDFDMIAFRLRRVWGLYPEIPDSYYYLDNLCNVNREQERTFNKLIRTLQKRDKQKSMSSGSKFLFY